MSWTRKIRSMLWNRAGGSSVRNCGAGNVPRTDENDEHKGEVIQLATDLERLEDTAREERAELKLLLTISEVAFRLGLGRSFIYELVMKGEIKSLKIGRARRIPVAALDEFVARCIRSDEDDAN